MWYTHVDKKQDLVSPGRVVHPPPWKASTLEAEAKRTVWTSMLAWVNSKDLS